MRVAGVVEVAGRPTNPVEAEPASKRRLPIGLAVGIVAVACLVAGGAWWWSRGGTVLEAAGGGYGGPALPNELFSVGISLETTSGHSVTLEAVSARRLAGARVQWSIYKTAPGGMGFGAVRGPLLPAWPTVPVHGYRVVQPAGHPERGATWIVASVRASRPGVYHLTDITITYRSGWRTRHTLGDSDVCLLVYPPAKASQLAKQLASFRPHITDLSSVDALVAQFELCSDPTLSQ